MSTERKRYLGEQGPFHVDQIRPGDRYELSQGHALYCAPTGAIGARRVGTGFAVLDTDPAVTEAGVDAGYALTESTLRAPDIAVGHVPDQPGWVTDGAPPLAVEYAGTGQDESSLCIKIDELFARGTKYIWVVRLVEPRHVEVHEPGKVVRFVGLDGMLEAPGILRNPVPVLALFDRDAAHRTVLDNLTQRLGYESFQAALRASIEKGIEQGIEQGIERGRRETAERLLLHRYGTIPAWANERLTNATSDELDAILVALLDAPTIEAAFAARAER